MTKPGAGTLPGAGFCVARRFSQAPTLRVRTRISENPQRKGPHAESAESAESESSRAVSSGFTVRSLIDGGGRHGVPVGEARSRGLSGTRKRWDAAGGHPHFFWFIADLVARAHRWKPWRVHHAQHRVPHVGRGGAHQASLGTSGTADGWKRGRGPSAFFSGTPIVSGAPRNPPFRLHLMRDPVNRLPRTTAAGTRRPSRAPRLCKIAYQVFVEAGSGALPAGIAAG